MPQMQRDIEQELSRIREEYKRRDASPEVTDRYSPFNESALLLSHGLERNLLALLKQHHFTQLADKKILDVGCGTGIQLQRFAAYGAKTAHLSGIDLVSGHIEQAQSLNPSIDWQVGSGHELPYADASFDLVTLFVVFSSILDRTLRQQIAEEVWRVRRSGGLILCYDFMYSNPRNPAVVGIPQKDMQHLFQHRGVHFDFRRVTLAPPLSRLIAPRAQWLAALLESLKILNTHYIGIIS